MAEGTDPLSLVYNALWDMLEGHVALASLVKAGNRIKYNDYRHSTVKDTLSNADLPELSVIPIGSLPQMQQTSNSTRITELYEARLVTGEQRLGQVGGFLPIKWEVLRAFVDWGDFLKALTWSGETFVKKTTFDEISDDMLNEELTIDRGFTGWVSLIRFRVEMWFSTTDLRTP